MTDVRAVVHQVLKESNPGLVNIQDHHLLAGELGISSIAMISIITELCDRLNVDVYQFSEKDLMATKTVSHLMTLFSPKATA